MSNSIEAVDDLITASNGSWKFDQQVANNFDSHVVKSVPFYKELQRMVIEISDYFVKEKSAIYDLGSSTGTTISLLHERHSLKSNIDFFGIEESASMVESSKAKCNYPNTHFIFQDITSPTMSLENASFITSILTMQFIPINQRVKVIQKIYDGLVEGGAFVLIEKIICDNSLFEIPWLELYWDFKERQGLTDSMIRQKSKSLRGVLKPLTLKQNIDLLTKVGYSNVEVFFKWYNFIGLIAVKGN